MTQPAPVIPQYLLVIGVLLLIVGVPLSCAVPVTFIGCQPSVFPANHQPIFPLRKKKHAAPSEPPASKESGASNGAALERLMPVGNFPPRETLTARGNSPVSLLPPVDLYSIVEKQRTEVREAANSMSEAQRAQYRAHVAIYVDEVDNAGKE